MKRFLSIILIMIFALPCLNAQQATDSLAEKDFCDSLNELAKYGQAGFDEIKDGHSESGNYHYSSYKLKGAWDTYIETGNVYHARFCFTKSWTSAYSIYESLLKKVKACLTADKGWLADSSEDSDDHIFTDEALKIEVKVSWKEDGSFYEVHLYIRKI